MSLSTLPFADLLAAFRAPQPVPGGGSASALAQVTAADVRPYVDVSAAKPGVPAPVAVDIAHGHAGVTVKEVVPAEAIWRAVRSRVTPVGN